MTLAATSTTWGLSDLELVDTAKPQGPRLRFTFTWLVDLEDKRVPAVSIPGFLYLKRANGEYKVLPPVRRSTTLHVYYAAIVSVDLLEMIEATLISEGWQKKVGKNNPVKALLTMPADLSTEIPKGKRHK